MQMQMPILMEIEHYKENRKQNIIQKKVFWGDGHQLLHFG